MMTVIVKILVMNKVAGRTLSNNLSFQNVLCIVCVNNRMFRILYISVCQLISSRSTYFAEK
jgi:hypothetical protein